MDMGDTFVCAAGKFFIEDTDTSVEAVAGAIVATAAEDGLTENKELS